MYDCLCIRSLVLVVLIIVSRISEVSAVEVAPGSPCSPQCIDTPESDMHDAFSTRTWPTDVFCNDGDIAGPNTTAKGRKWKDCLQCESNSASSDPRTEENDIFWFLVNMRFNFNFCVYGFENKAQTVQNNACDAACSGASSGMKNALLDRIWNNDRSLQYQYCEEGNQAFSKNVQTCISCLNKVPSSSILVNYLRALNVTCAQKPKIGGSTSIKLDFALFSTSVANTAIPIITATRSSTSSHIKPTIKTSSSSHTDSSSPSTPTGTAQPFAASASSFHPAPISPSVQRSLKLSLGLALGLGIPLFIILACLFSRYVRRHRAIMASNSHSDSRVSDMDARQRWTRREDWVPLPGLRDLRDKEMELEGTEATGLWRGRWWRGVRVVHRW